ncbi:hypothetical protein NDU88_003975 [Pleurodeles waltl]|uniref:Uncharacterized protein n=1 Tax=Pleurodeles waltl TaxID=8319 RepID=A0AAV7NR79_PLEWA|nr:hypothetical protein NDU88_003975 [Pleurodeles waltl]
MKRPFEGPRRAAPLTESAALGTLRSRRGKKGKHRRVLRSPRGPPSPADWGCALRVPEPSLGPRRHQRGKGSTPRPRRVCRSCPLAHEGLPGVHRAGRVPPASGPAPLNAAPEPPVSLDLIPPEGAHRPPALRPEVLSHAWDFCNLIQALSTAREAAWKKA